MEKEEPVMKSLKKWLRVLSRTQARMMMPRRPHKEKLGKVSSKIGTVRKSKTKKRRERKIGKRKTRWKCNEVGGEFGNKKDGRKLFAG